MNNTFWDNIINGLHLPLGLDKYSLKRRSQNDFAAYNQNRPKNDRSHFCHAPSKSLYFGHDGLVSPCCFNRRHLLGNVAHQYIKNIWNGIPIKTLRKALKKNDLALGCYSCEYMLKSKNYGSVGALMYDGLPSKNKMPHQLEFEADNTCNLECIMCTGEYSSAIRKNREHKAPFDIVYDETFIKQLQPFLCHLKDAKFYGGEPFLSLLYHKIWTDIIRVNPSCHISVQTNATVLNDTVKDFLKRGNFHISVSLDALDKDIYEKIRVNARYEKVMENLSFFRDYCLEKDHYFGIAVCPMRLNWKEIPLLLSFANKNKARIHFHTVWMPPSLALWNLSYTELKNIYQYLVSFNAVAHTEIENVNLNTYRSLIIQVEQWCNAAKKRDSEVLYPQNVIELKIELLKKIALWCDANIRNVDEKRELKEKYKDIVEEITEGFEKEALASGLKEILKSPVEFIIQTLDLDDKDKIMEKFKTFIFK